MIVQIVELKFPAELTFFELRSKIGQPLKRLFNDWQFDAVTLRLFDTEKLYSATLECKRIAITSLDQSDADFKNLVDKVIESYLHIIQIPSLKRFGFRRINAVPLEVNFEEAVKLFNEKIYPKDEKYFQIFPKHLDDVGFVGDFTKNGFKYHFMSGPMTKDETIKKTEQQNPFVIPLNKYKLSAANLLIDSDCYQDKITNPNYSTLVSKAFAESLDLHDKFYSYVLK